MTKLGLKTGSVSFHSGPVAPRPSRHWSAPDTALHVSSPGPGPWRCAGHRCAAHQGHTQAASRQTRFGSAEPSVTGPRPQDTLAPRTSAQSARPTHVPPRPPCELEPARFACGRCPLNSFSLGVIFLTNPPPRPFPGMLLGPRRKQTWRMEVLRRKGPDVFMERGRIFSYPPLDRDFAAQAFSRNFSFISDVMDQSSGVLLPLPNL